MVNELKLELRGVEPRPFEGKTEWRDLTDAERDAFAEKCRNALMESDVSETRKQAALLRGATHSGLYLSAAFRRYVHQEEHWYC